MKTSFRYFKKAMVLVLLLGLIGSLFQTTPVQAQDPTTLSITSTKSNICNGEVISVAVHIANVVDLYGFDLRMTFDPTVFEIISITDGGFLPSPTFSLDNTIDNVNGTLNYALTRYGGGTGANGNGDLVNIQIRVKSPGKTIQFTFVTTGSHPTLLSTSQSTSIPFVVGNTNGAATHACQLHFAANSRVNCTATTIPVRIEDIYDLYGYDVSITYDPTLIQIDAVTIDESFFSSPYMLEPVINQTPGTIQVYGAKRSPNPPSNGSGVLFTISAHTLIPNKNSGLTITSESDLSDYNGESFPLTITNYPIWTYPCEPNAVDLLSFQALRRPNRVVLTWETATEQDNVGFYLYRSKTETGKRIKLNGGAMIPAKEGGTSYGAFYKFKDFTINPLRRYYYWLEAVDAVDKEGKTEELGMIVSKPLKP